MMSDGQKYGSIMLDCRHKNADNVFWKIWEFQQKIGESNKKGEKKNQQPYYKSYRIFLSLL